MHRRAAFAKLNIVGVGLDIAFPQAVSRIRESTVPPVNCDFSQKAQAHENP
jgi:hypothetical protein